MLVDQIQKYEKSYWIQSCIVWAKDDGLEMPCISP